MSADRPTLRRIDLIGAENVRTADGTYPVLAVHDTTVRIRKTWGWTDIPYHQVLGVTK